MQSQKRSASLSGFIVTAKQIQKQKIQKVPLQRRHSQDARVQVQQNDDNQYNYIRKMINQSIEKINLKNSKGLAGALSQTEKKRSNQMKNKQIQSVSNSFSYSHQQEDSSSMHRSFSFKQSDMKWQALIVQDKRKIKGLKAKLRWKNQKHGVYIVVRYIFTKNYVQQGKWVNEGDLIIELQEINFEISLKQQRFLQLNLTDILQKKRGVVPSKGQGFSQISEVQQEWFVQILQQDQRLFHQVKIEKKVKSRQVIRLNKQKINPNYVLYHSPVVLAWSPQSLFCLTQNHIPKFKKSFICNRVSFLNHLQKQQEPNNIITENSQIIYEEQSKKLEFDSFYGWTHDQQLDFALTVQKEFLEYEQKKQHKFHKEKKETNQVKKINAEVIAYLNQIPPEIRKIYLNYFDPITHIQKFHRQDKLKVFSINHEIKFIQNEILYIVSRINVEKHKKIGQIVFQNQFSGYNSQLLAGDIDQFKFLIISNFIKGNLSERKLNGGISYSQILKAIILQNEYFHTQIQTYFQNAYDFIGKNPSIKITVLGSYQHFDTVRSQQLFIQILKQYLNKRLERQNIQIKLSRNTSVRNRDQISIKMSKKFILPMLHINWLLSQKQRIGFLQKIISILWIRDRNYMRFQYRQIAKIMATNSQIIKFFETLNGIVTKLTKGKLVFIQNLIKTYETQKQRSIQIDLYARREFFVECRNCGKINSTFQLSQVSRLQTCNKCKVMTS